MSFFTLKLSEENKKIENFPKFQRQLEKTNIFKYKPPEVHFTIRDRVPYNNYRILHGEDTRRRSMRRECKLGTRIRREHYVPRAVMCRMHACMQRCRSFSEGDSPGIILLESLANTQRLCSFSGDNKGAKYEFKLRKQNFEGEANNM